MLVYRDTDDAVRFVELNPVTSRLLNLLAASPSTGKAACRQIAEELQHPYPAQLIVFGCALLTDFCAQGIILGSQR